MVPRMSGARRTVVLTRAHQLGRVQAIAIAAGLAVDVIGGDVPELVRELRRSDRVLALIGVDDGLGRGELDAVVPYGELTAALLTFAVQAAEERALLLSRLREAEAAAAHRSHLASIGVVVAGAMHEINNPAAALRLSLEALVDLLGDVRREIDALERLVPSDAEELSATVARVQALLAPDGASGLIPEALDDLRVIRDVARDLRTIASAQTADVPPEVVDLRMVVRQALRLSPVDRDVVHVEIDFPDSTPLLWLPRSRLVQIVSNLVTNACHAMQQIERPLHRLRLSVREDETTLLLAVSDTGVGIDEAALERVFEPFYTTKGPERGTGLGLAMSREIVRRLGGDLSIDSVPGEGTIAMVFLPLSLRAQVPAPTVSRHRARLLVVDSRLERLRLVERALRHDYEILVAHSGLDALALLESGTRVDGILGDVAMPEMDGRRLAVTIATHWQDGAPPVVLFGDEPEWGEGVEPAPGPADDAGWLALARRVTEAQPLH